MKKYRVSLAEALSHIPGVDDERFAVVFEHGSPCVEIFLPHEVDT